MTPTERVKRALTGHWKESNIVDADLARQLAVELEEMTTKRDGLEVIARMNSDYARAYELERDAFRADAVELANALLGHFEEFKQWTIKGKTHNSVIEALTNHQQLLEKYK